MTGIAGFEKSEDCLIKIVLTDSGGIKIDMESPVEKFFKSSITATIQSVCRQADIKNAQIQLYDFGCLDFVIRARLKTAINRARGIS